MLGAAQERRLSASTLSTVTSSPGATSIPCTRYSGLNATVRSVPSNLASSASWAWPTSCVMAAELEARSLDIAEAHQGGPPGQELPHRRTASRRTSRPTVSRFGWACGIQALVGRELAPR